MSNHPERPPLEDLYAQMPVYVDRYLSDRIKQRSQGSYKLLCIFHKEKTASFHVNNRNGTWRYHCFGCGANGTLVGLHAHRARLDPQSREAIKATAESVNFKLPDAAPLTLKQKQEWTKQKKRTQALERRAQQEEVKAELVKDYIDNQAVSTLIPFVSETWRMDLFEDSPCTLYAPEYTPSDFIEQLFQPNDLIWLGDIYDTGDPRNSVNIKTCKEWIESSKLPPRIAGGVFKKNSYSRSLSSVERSPFIVLESDTLIGFEPVTNDEKELNKALSCAFCIYAEHQLNLNPRAIVDSGNRSLHLWIDRPPDDEMKDLIMLAEGFRFDTGLLRLCPAAPLRMPNTIHEKTNKPAKLLWLNTQQNIKL